LVIDRVALATTIGHCDQARGEAANSGDRATTLGRARVAAARGGRAIGQTGFLIGISGAIGGTIITTMCGTTGTTTGTTTFTTAITGLTTIGGITTIGTIRTIPISTIGVRQLGLL